MSALPESSESAAPVTKPLPPDGGKPAASSHDSAGWKKYVTPLLVVALALAVVITITRNWNAWEGGKAEQITDDAYVRGDLTPLSTKVAGIVRTVHVADFQRVHQGELIVELQDDDYRAQVDQAGAAVEAARAAIENNRRQRELQDAHIAKALAGIDQAKAQIAAADERLTAQLASREADLKQARTLLLSSELAAEAERRSKAVVESQAMQLQADLHAKQANLAAAVVNLGYAKIYAPGEGTVGERQVRTGQLVSPGTQVIAFVDVTKWVQANYRETQLTNVKIGDPAELRIDQYPGQVIHGKVLEIAPASGSQFSLLPPDNATGNFTKVVQRIPVKIALDDTTFAAKLRPGLSVTATVRTKR